MIGKHIVGKQRELNFLKHLMQRGFHAASRVADFSQSGALPTSPAVQERTVRDTDDAPSAAIVPP